MNVLFSVRDVTKTFHLSKKQQKILKTHETKKVAVNHLSFDAYEGEIYGLLGPNGAGKTTTLRIASSLIKPDTGDVLIQGISVVDDPSEVRRHIGFLTTQSRSPLPL